MTFLIAAQPDLQGIDQGYCKALTGDSGHMPRKGQAGALLVDVTICRNVS